MPASRADLAARLHRAAYRTGDFVLRSGARSEVYFDKYRFESDPELLREVGEGLAELVPGGTDVLAGLELGGIPLVTITSQLTGLPAVFVRKRAKEYGTREIAEGGAVEGRRVCVLEDVITSGGQVIESCEELRRAGADVVAVLCVVDREAGGAGALAERGLELHALFTLGELERAAAG